ncbi:MAG: hypothetical protein LUG18_09170 [Candidatus Azobacteroides sp.]|nr:hypothetical protein [Candidatus Azobacteroides sp.]
MFAIQEESLAMQELKEEIPPLFQDPYLKDVSGVYFDPVDVSMELTVAPPEKKKIAYIMVFDNVNWQPVHWGKIEGKKATFTQMAKECMYIVMYYHNQQFYPASVPFYISSDGRITLKNADPEKKETLSLFSRYPDFGMILHARRMEHGEFQGADNPEFTNAEVFYRIENPPPFSYQHVPVKNEKKFRYIRYMGGRNSFANIAELEFYKHDKGELRKLSGRIIGTPGSCWDNPATTREKVFDGDRFTFFDAPDADSCWVGLDLGVAQPIAEIRFLPRHPSHHLHTGDTYELFYWDKTWLSLGKKIGEEWTVTYEEVPQNALFLLYNHSKREEERIFTYEKGTQIWW